MGNTRLGRCIHLIDFGSLIAHPHPTAAEYRHAWQWYREQAAPVRAGDHVFASCSAADAPVAIFALIDAPLQWRIAATEEHIGRALADEVDIVHAAGRFDSLAVAGAGAALGDLVLRADRRGMTVRGFTFVLAA
jgi:hypothetical protein